MKKLTLPQDIALVSELNAGDEISLSGTIYTARDAAHLRMTDALKRGEEIPLDLNSAAIYYCGPTPAREGEVIGSCGPTTSGRMDDYTPYLMDRGLKITIGKGKRSPDVIQAIMRNGGVYLMAVGGAAALMKSRVLACELIAYGDLGCEAIYKLTVKDMPLLVAADSRGNVLCG